MVIKSALVLTGIAMGHVARSAGFSPPTAGLAAHSFRRGQEPTDDYIAQMRKIAQTEAMERDAGLVTHTEINVDVWFHAVSGAEKDLASEESLLEGFQILQDNYAPYNITFNYIGYTRTINNDWAVDGGHVKGEMQTALRKGDYRTLNYYIVDAVPYWLRRCTFPGTVIEGDERFLLDGCYFSNSLQGKQVVQTTGHWFGLLRTNAGHDCDGEGDLIDDTPAELQNLDSFYCPDDLKLDTCPDHPGLDPVHNYMSPSASECWTHFTEGQMVRMNSLWEQFRADV